MRSIDCLRANSAVSGLSAALFLGLTMWAVTASDARASESNADLVKAEAIEKWHGDIANVGPPAGGCFTAEYPDLQWTQVECVSPPAFHTGLRQVAKHLRGAQQEALASSATAAGFNAGATYDYAIKTPTLISSATGSFPVVTGVTSVQTVNTEEGGDAVTGANYSLQLNTEFAYNDATCAAYNYSSCLVWQQYIYSTYSTEPNQNAPVAFIESWFFPDWAEWVTRGCPAGWNDIGPIQIGAAQYGQCYVNSSAVVVSAVPITSLASLKLTATANGNGNDKVTFTNGTTAHSVTTLDSVLRISGVWRTVEFNVFGDEGAGEAVFNPGSSITVKTQVNSTTQGNSSCIGPTNGGTTAEQNNLNLGPCSLTNGAFPSIQFVESN